MSTRSGLLGEIQWADVVSRLRTMSPTTRERVVILGALLVVTLAVVIWALFFRGKKSHSRSHRHSSHRSRELAPGSVGESAGGSGEAGPRKRRKWRRQRREHRPLNPTLAQTGGLPPIRASDPPPPPP
jgi:hypothetical protein